MRDSARSRNPNPVTVTFGQAAQVSNQITEYMLCERCEQVFGRSEQYVARLAYTTSGDPLALTHLGVTHSQDRPPSVRRISAETLESDKLVFFGTSVIWRACVAARPDTGKPNLGMRYVEEIRKYLNGESEFPRRARLIVTVLDQPRGVKNPVHNRVSFPVTVNNDGYHQHAFYLCGLHFSLIVGRLLPADLDTMCLHHASDKMVFCAPASKIGLLHDIAARVRGAAPKGRLK